MSDREEYVRLVKSAVDGRYNSAREAVMIELTPDQRQALEQLGGEPIRAVDPATSAEYVILRAEVYDRLKLLLTENAEWTEEAYGAAMEVFARDGWDDPRMDVYDTFDPRRHP
jgi:hypothetical protein